MPLLDESEKLDFHNMVIESGFSCDDFVIQELENASTKLGIYDITGKVLIQRVSSGMSREYTVGNGTSWLPQFEAELKHGSFGKSD